jgi:hypothetical protein
LLALKERESRFPEFFFVFSRYKSPTPAECYIDCSLLSMLARQWGLRTLLAGVSCCRRLFAQRKSKLTTTFRPDKSTFSSFVFWLLARLLFTLLIRIQTTTILLEILVLYLILSSSIWRFLNISSSAYPNCDRIICNLSKLTNPLSVNHPCN